LLGEAFKIEVDKHKTQKQITNFVTIGSKRELVLLSYDRYQMFLRQQSTKECKCFLTRN